MFQNNNNNIEIGKVQKFWIYAVAHLMFIICFLSEIIKKRKNDEAILCKNSTFTTPLANMQENIFKT